MDHIMEGRYPEFTRLLQAWIASGIAIMSGGGALQRTEYLNTPERKAPLKYTCLHQAELFGNGLRTSGSHL